MVLVGVFKGRFEEKGVDFFRLYSKEKMNRPGCFGERTQEDKCTADVYYKVKDNLDQMLGKEVELYYDLYKRVKEIRVVK